jgi:replicative DNA helicase
MLGVLSDVINAERVLLCGILLQAKEVLPLIASLEAKHFYVEKHAIIYRTIQTLFLEGEVNLLTLSARLAAMDKLAEAGGRSELAGLLEEMWTGSPKELANLIIDAYKKRRIAEIGARMTQLSPLSDANETITSLGDELRELTSSELPSESPRSIGEFIADYYSHLEDLAAGGAKNNVAPTGFYDLDAMIQGGFGKGELITIAGRSGMGKTSFAVQAAYNFAIANTHRPVLLFSLEMPKVQLMHRLVSLVSGVELTYLLTGQISQSQYGQITNALSEIGEATNLTVFDRMGDSWRSIIAQIRTQHAKQELGLVVIDYLQLIAGGGEKSNWILEEVTRSLKLLAIELNIPIVILSQLNRGVESQSNKRPGQSDLRGSGAIEQDSDKVIAIYRDDYYNPESVEKGIAEILVLKNRMGPTGTIKLLFDAQFTAFKNLARH